MSLQKQIIPLSLASGVNTKLDPKQLGTDNLYDMRNIVFPTTNSFKKRNGYRALTKYTLDGTKYENARASSVFNRERQLFTDKELFAYSSTVDRWVRKGDVANTKVTSTPILRNTHSQTEPHVAIIENVACYAWKDSRGGVRCSVVDTATNTSFLYDISVSTTGVKPKVQALDNLFFIFFADSGEIKYRVINSAQPTTLEAEVSISSDLESTNIFDVCTIDRKIFIAFDSTLSGGSLSIFTMESSGTTGSTISLPSEDGSTAINVSSDAQFRVLVTYSDNTQVKFLAYNYTLSLQAIAPTVIETIADVKNCNAIQKTATLYQIVYEISASPTSNYLIKKNTITASAVVGTASVINRSVGLASEQFIYNDTVYFLSVHDSTLQSTYFLMSETGLIISKVSPSLGGSILPASTLAKVATVDDINFTVPSQIRTTGVADTPSRTIYFLPGVNSSTFNFQPTDNYQSQVLGKNLYIAGGVLLNYDGFSVSEDNFHLYPENIGTPSQSASGGSLTDGQRQYSFVYMWTDNKGQLHRSAPSIPITFTNSAGGSSQSNTIAVPTLRLTAKTEVIIEGYRTEALGTTFYRFTSTATPTYNDKTVNSVNIVDTISDTDLLDNEILYTTGGVLDNIAAPAASIVFPYKNRMVLIGLENQNQVVLSKIKEEGKPVEFSDAINILVEDRNSGVTAGGVIDGNLILFKAGTMYVMAGDGPNNTGTQNDFTLPSLISSDVGCSNQDSVVETPDGLMFQSQKGIYLLDRGLETTYIGQEVERFNDLRITSATLVPNTNQVRFTTAEDITLVYDYYVRRWTIFSNHGAYAAHTLNTNYEYLNRREEAIWVETPGEYLDNGEQILISFESGWISFAGLQGVQRVYKFLMLGDLHNRHKLRVSSGINLTNAYTSVKIVDSSEFTSTSAYGDSSPYGSDSEYGGEHNVLQLRFDLKDQKCQSIRFKIEEIQNEVLGEGLSLSAFTFEVGGKQGLFKPNQSQIFGMTR